MTWIATAVLAVGAWPHCAFMCGHLFVSSPSRSFLIQLQRLLGYLTQATLWVSLIYGLGLTTRWASWLGFLAFLALFVRSLLGRFREGPNGFRLHWPGLWSGLIPCHLSQLVILQIFLHDHWLSALGAIVLFWFISSWPFAVVAWAKQWGLKAPKFWAEPKFVSTRTLLSSVIMFGFVFLAGVRAWQGSQSIESLTTSGAQSSGTLFCIPHAR